MSGRVSAVGRLAAVVALLASAFVVPAAAAQVPVVRAVLFFSPACGHCEYVINELLFPVWFPEYGGEAEVRWDESQGGEAAFYLGTNGTLEILLVDVSMEAGARLFGSSTEALGIPEERRGVPRLVVGDRYLIGSEEIPNEFPGIIEAGLVSGGVGWPAIPGLEGALATIPAALPDETTTTTVPGTSATTPGSTTSGPSSVTTTPPSTTTTSAGGVLPGGDESPWDRFRRDQTANSIALAVLVLMMLSLAAVVPLARRGRKEGGPGLAVPFLALAGLGVAVYLAFVETSGAAAVCGPVGDCNAVQQSEWAKVFGVIPVGLIGVAGYAVMLASWALTRFGPSRLADRARVALLAGTVTGVGFSVYLTFLEPFVIGATCMWCLGSAAIVTLLMWLAARPGMAAWQRLRARAPSPAAAGEGGG
ncbi:MAG: vitamin K epoxide reductase family protein [Actinomycetota bacterium]